MPQERSQLLNRRLPEQLSVLLRQQGIDPDEAWLAVETDLNLKGGYEQVFLLAESHRLLVVAMPSSNNPKLVRLDIPRQSISEVRTRGGVGGGFLEAYVNGVAVEVLVYSNTNADIFNKVARKLHSWCKGLPVSVGAEDDLNPRKCAQCGMTLQFPGDVCRRCTKQSTVFIRVIKLMRPYAGKAILMMVFVFLATLVAMVPPLVIKVLIDKVLNPAVPMPFDEAQRWLIGLVGAMFGVYALSTAITIVRGMLSTYVGTQISYDMRSRVFDHLTKLGIAYYDRYNIGQLMTRVSGDTEAMMGFVDQLTSGFLAQLLQVVAVGIIMFCFSWKLALFTLLPAPIVMVSIYLFYRRIRPRYSRIWDANSKLGGVLNTILSGIRVVKAFGQETHERNRFGHSSQHLRDSTREVHYVVAAVNPVIGLLLQLGGVIVWFVGGHDVLKGSMTIGSLTAFFFYLGMFYAPLGTLTQLTNWLSSFLTAAQRTFEILDTKPEIDQSVNSKSLAKARGAIEFKNVTFGYNRHEPILKDISFSIDAGEHIGIVGKSGSGKTTLVNLIGRFYDVDQGQVTIDGQDIRDIDIDDLRKSIGVVLQEPFLFRGTIQANVTYGQHAASPEQILAAAKAANAHDFITRLPLGYDTYVGERGAGLSGGERQRVSIARALLFDPRIIILDEATSSVDTESEKLIQDALLRVTKNRTTISIAHRLSTLKNSDRIFVVDNGRIVERGTHEELMALEGLYYRLVKIQTELSTEPSIDTLAAEENFEAEKPKKSEKTKK